jgi:hypothetical protein
MSFSSRTVVSVLGVAAVIGAASAGSGAAASSSGRHALPGSVAPWAQAAQRSGASDSSARVDFRVYLSDRGRDAAAALASAVSTPGNAQYGKFLTSAQYRSRFSPAQTDVDAVSRWLRSQGFTVGYVPANRKYVEAAGSVAQASAAFGTSFSDYTVKGHKLRANSAPLTVPDTLRGVEAVLGLDDSAALVQHHATYQPPAGFRVGTPCSAYWAEKVVPHAVRRDGGTPTPTADGTPLPSSPSAYAPCGYAGAQLQNAYGVGSAIASGNDGTGVTVAVIDAFASPTAGADLARYSREHGLPAPKLKEQVPPGIYKHPTTKKYDPSGWAGEEQLDLEAVHTMAPGATILYVGAPNNGQSRDAALLLLGRRWRRDGRRCRRTAESGLPGLEPLGDSGRRHLARGVQEQHAHVRGGLGDRPQHPARRTRLVEADVPVRQRWWHLASLRPAVLPARRRSLVTEPDLRWGADARGPRRLGPR